MFARGCSSCDSPVFRTPRLIGVLAITLLLAAMAPSQGHAQSNTSLALVDPAHDASAGGGPIVIPQSQRAPLPTGQASSSSHMIGWPLVHLAPQGGSSSIERK